MTRRRIYVSIGVGAGISLVPTIAELLGLGSYEFEFISLAGLCFAIGILTLIAGFFMKRTSSWAQSVIFCLVFPLLTLPCTKLSVAARRLSFRLLAGRSTALISGIENYTRDHGAPPDSLDALIPHYVKGIPSTHMLAYPRYKYTKFGPELPVLLRWYDLGSRHGAKFQGLWKYPDGPADHGVLVVTTNRDGRIREVDVDRVLKPTTHVQFDKDRWHESLESRASMVRSLVATLAPVGKDFRELSEVLGVPDGQRVLLGANWELSVPCSTGLANWDVFFYWPGQAYPKDAYGGNVERIANWAYVHE